MAFRLLTRHIGFTKISVATRIQSDTHLVHLGIAEKVPLIAVCLGAFVTGFVLAYSQSWKLALAMTSIFPCIAMAGAVMTRCVDPHLPTAHCTSDVLKPWLQFDDSHSLLFITAQ